MLIPITITTKSLSFTQLPFQLTTNLSLKPKTRFLTSPIRMGGGPRTYPGGVSKWQWKRMQAKKAKQLLQARLSRERQIYEMRKRAELKAAVSELERPWETVEKPPNLFSLGADEHLKVLADRFHKPGGLDLWSERDGPELFRTDNGLPSARCFPKGSVHSVKPYGTLADLSSGFQSLDLDEGTGVEETSVRRKGYSGMSRTRRGSLNSDGGSVGDVELRKNNGIVRNGKSVMRGSSDSRLNKVESRNDNGVVREGGSVMKGNRRKDLSETEQKKSGYDGRNQRRDYGKSRVYEKGVKRDSKVVDMSLQNDGRYGL